MAINTNTHTHKVLLTRVWQGQSTKKKGVTRHLHQQQKVLSAEDRNKERPQNPFTMSHAVLLQQHRDHPDAVALG